MGSPTFPITEQMTRSRFPRSNCKNASKSTAAHERPRRVAKWKKQQQAHSRSYNPKQAISFCQRQVYLPSSALWCSFLPCLPYNHRDVGSQHWQYCNAIHKSPDTHPLFPAASPVRRIDVFCSYQYSHPEPMETRSARVHPEKAITLAWSFGLRQLELQW